MKGIEIDSWTALKTVMAGDLEYWKQVEAQAVMAKGNDDAIKSALAMTATSIGITEYYIDIMEKIENGELIGGSEEP